VLPALTELLARLDADQQKVAAWTPADGNLRVVAAAGSGKTTTITALVGNLIAKGVNPNRIVVTTFTAKAGNELKNRIRPVVTAPAYASLRIGTFHSLALRAVRNLDPGQWQMRNNVDMPGKERAPDVPSAGILWRTIVQFGTVPGTLAQSLKVPNADPPSYARAVDLFRSDMIDDPAELTPAALRARGVRLTEFKKAWQMYLDAKRALRAWDYADCLSEYRNLLSVGILPADADVVIVDEAQDNTQTQIEIARRLAGSTGRVILVGDGRQCVPAGERVATPTGMRPIEDLRVGDLVLSSVANGKVDARPIRAVTVTRKPVTLRFTLADGRTFATTPDHTVFASLGGVPPGGGQFVYLMQRSGYGFRVGVSARTGSVRGGKMSVRTTEEIADRMWILGTAASGADARKIEHTTAYTYGIPMAPFKRRGDDPMFATDEEAAEFFQKFQMNGYRLLGERGLSFDRPAYVGKCSSSGRVAVNVTIAGVTGGRPTTQVSVEVAADKVPGAARRVFEFRPGRRGCLRVRRYFREARDALNFARALAFALDGYVAETLSVGTSDRRVFAIDAAGLHPGMLVPVNVEGTLQMVAVTAREEIHEPATCFDLEIAGSANFLVNDVAVHNCIHVWRGAYPDLFLRGLPKTKTLPLNTNYRSVPSIVDLGNSVAHGYSWALGTVAKANRTGAHGTDVSGNHGDEGDEADWIAGEIEAGIAGGKKPGYYAVLTRTNAALLDIQAALTARNIENAVVGDSTLFTSREAMDVMSYCVLAYYDALPSLEQIVNRPTRFLGKDYVTSVRSALPMCGGDLIRACDVAGNTVKPGQRQGVQMLVQTLRNLRGKRGWVDVVLEVESLLVGAAVARRDRDKGELLPPDEDLPGAYRAVCRAARRFSNVVDFIDFADRCSGNTKIGAEDALPEDKVTLSTIHRSKGLEWGHVFVQTTEGVLPHKRSVPADRTAMTGAEIESEIRLFYVAITRAKDRATLTWYGTYDRDKQVGGPSRFLQRFGLLSAGDDDVDEEDGAE
jgi:superfamily I DNA/RNA helicase